MLALGQVLMKRVYLDANATTKPDQDLVKKVSLWLLEGWANPSSIYQEAREPKLLLRKAYKNLANCLNVSPFEIIFTSGGTESNNHAIKGVYEALKDTGKTRYIFSDVEHPSVLEPAKWIEKQKGMEVCYCSIDKDGNFDLKEYESYLNDKVALVSVMFANNETGHVFPIKNLAQKAHEVGALFHTDMVQALGKEEFCLKDLDVDLASFSAHKFYSLKGSGALYVKKNTPLKNLILGGKQERGRRAGTQNVLSAVCFAEICEQNKDRLKEEIQKVRALRDELEEEILETISDVIIVGRRGLRVSNTINLIVKDLYSESLLINLDLKGFSLSAGSACSSGISSGSHVLLAMGFTRNEVQRSLRVSLSWGTTRADIKAFAKVLKEEVERLRALESD